MSTKTRRPVAVATPPRKVVSRYTLAEKESLLENYDLEVADKTRAFHDQLAISLQAFLLRQETEIMRLPRELRSMTLADLEAKWGGSWAGTVQRIARERMEREDGDRRRAEEAAAAAAASSNAATAAEDGVKGKRQVHAPAALSLSVKRGTGATVTLSPERKKNARRDSAQASSASTSKSAKSRKPRTKAAQTPSKGPSTLPQNHIFAPSLPPATPGYARQARANETTFSANGSPIVLVPSKAISAAPQPHMTFPPDRALPPLPGTVAVAVSARTPTSSSTSAGTSRFVSSSASNSVPISALAPASASATPRVLAATTAIPPAPPYRDHDNDNGTGNDHGNDNDTETETNSESELDLPDAAELEAKLLARQSAAASATAGSSHPSRKPKRAPSLIFRQPIALPTSTSVAASASASASAPMSASASALTASAPASTDALSTIPLSDGRTISFNPLQMDPKVIDDELEQGGLGGAEKELVRKLVREEVVHRLAGMMELWKVG